MTLTYEINHQVTNEALNALFDTAWPAHEWRDFQPILTRSLAYVCAFDGQRLIGFVNLAWDGGIHAFLLDTTVHRNYQRQGIGQQLVKRALAVGRERGMEWVHTDYEAHLSEFYEGCGFKPTEAGLYHCQE